ncbi:MAG TPA: DUF6687 family protein [Candidatus Manganitrophaceae bacterium]|nr:DUF6687 family protein [Candidatus Manganitrophaceae bacterium]
MVFYFYEDSMKGVAKISVDGLVPQSYHLSHWKGNNTPAPLKADTSTEIALRYLSHPNPKIFFPQVHIITNNHFDTDGLLAVWALLNPKKAEPMAARLIHAAEAGDFCSFSSEEGVQMNLLIQAFYASDESPFIPQLAGYPGPKEAFFYKTLLPLLPDLFRKKDEYRALWREAYDEILQSMELFEKGIIGVEEYEQERLSVVIDERRPARQATDHHCQGNLFLVIEDRERVEGGFGYELEYRYYAWADTVTRPPIVMIPMESLAEHLNRHEGPADGKWMTRDYAGRSMTSVLKFTDEKGTRCLSRLYPEQVIQLVLSHLRQKETES